MSDIYLLIYYYFVIIDRKWPLVFTFCGINLSLCDVALLPLRVSHYSSLAPPAGVLLENFPVCKELLIPPGTQNYVVRMRLYDVNKQLLCLTIRIILRAQGALKVLISAPYWLVNKTGAFLEYNDIYRIYMGVHSFLPH